MCVSYVAIKTNKPTTTDKSKTLGPGPQKQNSGTRPLMDWQGLNGKKWIRMHFASMKTQYGSEVSGPCFVMMQGSARSRQCLRLTAVQGVMGNISVSVTVCPCLHLYRYKLAFNEHRIWTKHCAWHIILIIKALMTTLRGMYFYDPILQTSPPQNHACWGARMLSPID